MQNLNPNQLICPYYSPDYKVIPQYIEMKAGESLELYSKMSNYFIFLFTGGIIIDFNQYTNRPISENEMFFLPKNHKFKWQAIAETTLMLTGYNASVFPCSNVKNRILFKRKSIVKFLCRGIPMKEEMKSLVYQMKNYVDTGINCHHLYLLKYKEMQLLFKHCYTQEEIAQIFYMSLGNSPLFVEMILDNYSKVKTSKELAHLLGYSMRQFEKLFKENFDDTPYKWMQERKAKQILQKLMDPDIPLKQIMYEFKFNTSSHFNFYCKQHLGGTPIQVRNGKKDNLSSK